MILFAKQKVITSSDSYRAKAPGARCIAPYGQAENSEGSLSLLLAAASHPYYRSCSLSVWMVVRRLEEHYQHAT